MICSVYKRLFFSSQFFYALSHILFSCFHSVSLTSCVSCRVPRVEEKNYICTNTPVQMRRFIHTIHTRRARKFIPEKLIFGQLENFWEFLLFSTADWTQFRFTNMRSSLLGVTKTTVIAYIHFRQWLNPLFLLQPHMGILYTIFTRFLNCNRVSVPRSSVDLSHTCLGLYKSTDKSIKRKLKNLRLSSQFSSR